MNLFSSADDPELHAQVPTARSHRQEAGLLLSDVTGFARNGRIQNVCFSGNSLHRRNCIPKPTGELTTVLYGINTFSGTSIYTITVR